MKMIKVKSCKECPYEIGFGCFKPEWDLEGNRYDMAIGKTKPYCNEKKDYIPEFTGDFPEDFCPLPGAPEGD